MDGWIKIHRKILEWEWYKDNNVKILFLHLLLTVNHKDKEWNGNIIKRGQKVTSIKHLSQETGLTQQQVRTALKKLQITSEITIKTTNKYSVVTIEKYSDYQIGEEKNNTQINEQSNTKITTNKNIRNIYLYLLNKYKRQSAGNFSEYVKAVKDLKEDNDWQLLNEEEQRKLISQI